jgi:hypothetical protein
MLAQRQSRRCRISTRRTSGCVGDSRASAVAAPPEVAEVDRPPSALAPSAKMSATSAARACEAQAGKGA